MILARLSLIAVCALPLCAFQCSGPERERYTALIFGADVAAKTALAPQPVAFAALTVEPESSEEVVTVEPEAVAVVEPEPEVIVPPPEPVCETTLWRGTYYDCHGQIVGYVE